MGAAKKWNESLENKSEAINLSIIEGGLLNHEDHGPAEDYFVFEAFEDIKYFFNFLPYHISNWMLKSDKHLIELEKQKDKNIKDYRYFNFF